MKWFAVLLTLGCILPGSLALQEHLSHVDSRIRELEVRTQADAAFLETHAGHLRSVRAELAEIEQALQGGESAGKPKTVQRKVAKVGRNDPCPCGSGKKYKKCHGAGK